MSYILATTLATAFFDGILAGMVWTAIIVIVVMIVLFLIDLIFKR